MRNANLEMIHCKTLQLEAMVSMLRVMASGRVSELCPDIVGNYAWLMSDLIDQIRCGIDAVSGVSA
ncbi:MULTISPECIES: hypothetical protein [Burkholderia]|uniref:Uncharacterized protein n=1 Tax=Burkholderia anthina TaxID=179879 RepID=A0A7T6VDB1_9BURK|nr:MULTISPECIES: hypothetical protein [Burkholderia]AIP64344.1 hypothetical protein DR62_2149 [Burkholderia thailandensis]AOI52560.1 hypothetical protein WI24_12660 [Burkholderia thailandensis]KVF76870.1 hypothetical protein WS75_10795 [Burkholderia sp. FL-7-2-10-S1-D7]QQK01840.1 hypothetical protein JFN94_12175 [Burkholderia anthina]